MLTTQQMLPSSLQYIILTLLTSESFLNVTWKYTCFVLFSKCAGRCMPVLLCMTVQISFSVTFTEVRALLKFSPLLSSLHTEDNHVWNSISSCTKWTLLDMNLFSYKPLCTRYRRSPSFSGISAKEMQNFRVYLSLHMLIWVFRA